MTEETLRRRVRRILASLAREQTTVTYRDLAALAEVPPPQSIHKRAETLEETMREDHENGVPLIAALVVGRGSRGLPQRGFFELLRQLGRYDGPDEGPAVSYTHLTLPTIYSV